MTAIIQAIAQAIGMTLAQNDADAQADTGEPMDAATFWIFF